MSVNISFDDFLKVDMRAGTVLKVEEVPKSKKLLKLQVSFGPELGERTIMAGIAGSFTPDTLVNVRVTAVVNLEPRALMGVESHGMLLAAGDSTGKLFLLNPGNVPDGTRIG